MAQVEVRVRAGRLEDFLIGVSVLFLPFIVAGVAGIAGGSLVAVGAYVATFTVACVVAVKLGRRTRMVER